MENEEKFFCWGCGKVEIPEPVSCCSGHECGCMGQPIDPPFCSDECQREWSSNRKSVTIPFEELN
jgi:hypothetical protein